MKLKNAKNTATEELIHIAKSKSKKSYIWIPLTLTIFSCLIFSLCFLYQPAKDYYISIRQQDKLKAQYEALKNTNSELNQEIAELQTKEGIQQKARENLGLIEQGESVGVVPELEKQDKENSSATSTSSKLAYKNIKTPETWYSPFFNFIFDIHE